MKRRELWNVVMGLTGLSLLAGCKSRISKSAYDKSLGDPYRCSKCGHLIRSKTDMATKRCPRCYARRIVKISEEEMTGYLKQKGE